MALLAHTMKVLGGACMAGTRPVMSGLAALHTITLRIIAASAERRVPVILPRKSPRRSRRQLRRRSPRWPRQAGVVPRGQDAAGPIGVGGITANAHVGATPDGILAIANATAVISTGAKALSVAVGATIGGIGKTGHARVVLGTDTGHRAGHRARILVDDVPYY